VTAGVDQLEFVGGNLASDFSDLKALFDFCKGTNDPKHYCHDKDSNPETWTTAVVIYDYEDLTSPCSNPNKPLTIVGFATVTIEQVLTAPAKTIMASLKCGNAEEGRGGGGNYGTIGTISGLVQ